MQEWVQRHQLSLRICNMQTATLIDDKDDVVAFHSVQFSHRVVKHIRGLDQDDVTRSHMLLQFLASHYQLI